MASGMGAGAGADMLQRILLRKMQESIALANQKNASERLALDRQNSADVNSRFYSGQQFTAGENQKGREFTSGENQKGREFTATENQAGRTFTAGENQKGREFTSGENQKGREFTSGENQKGREFTGQQGDLNRGNAVRIAGINGQNALAVANVRHPDATAAAAQKEQNEVEDALALIKQIREDRSLPTATGPIQGRGLGLLQDLGGVTRVNALHDNLVNKLSLAQAGKLKGQGPVSNFERDMLAKAATALQLKLNDPDYLTELGKVEQQFQRLLTGPRATPAAAASPAVDLVWDGTKFVKPGGGR